MERQKYLSVSDIVNGEEYPFTLGQMRHYLAMRHKNGLTVAVRKIGKRLYLHQDLFETWIEKQGGEGK